MRCFDQPRSISHARGVKTLQERDALSRWGEVRSARTSIALISSRARSWAANRTQPFSGFPHSFRRAASMNSCSIMVEGVLVGGEKKFFFFRGARWLHHHIDRAAGSSRHAANRGGAPIASDANSNGSFPASDTFSEHPERSGPRTGSKNGPRASDDRPGHGGLAGFELRVATWTCYGFATQTRKDIKRRFGRKVD